MLTGDPCIEFDPFTYVLHYSFLQQAQNYPAIAQVLPHLIQATPENTPTHSHPPSPNSSGDFFTPPTTPEANQPQQGSSKAKTLKLLHRVLRGGRMAEFQDPLPDRQSWIQKNMAKMHAKAALKVKAKAAAKSAKSLAS